jgi:uncharacterized protein
MIENHSLALELPEYKDTIHNLKLSNAHFAKLFDEYHTKDKEIHRIEQGAEVSSDEYIEMLKKQRLHLKDSLFALIKSANSVV